MPRSGSGPLVCVVLLPLPGTVLLLDAEPREAAATATSDRALLPIDAASRCSAYAWKAGGGRGKGEGEGGCR